MLSIYQSYVQKSRYARFLPNQNRREHLEETVGRYVEFICHAIEDEYGLELTDLRNELREEICSLNVMPSMRAMMTAGKALTRDNTCGYNCFHGEETFITGEGVKSFIDTVDERVSVWTKEGWKNATVKSFGIQPLQQVTLRPTKSHSNIRETIKVTPNHRWITNNRGEVTDLQVGDVIKSSVVPKGEFKLGAFIRGFGFGDGTIDSRGNARIRLCGEKDKKWKSLFETYGHASIWEPESMNGDVMISYHKGYFSDWKKLPLEYVNDSDWLASWLDGYLAADGHNNSRQPGLSSQNEQAIQFVEFIAPLCGYIVTGKNVSQIMETNYGERKSPLIRITLRNSCDWYVTTIEPLDEDEVFCVVEPDTQSFTLGAGILTGNCSYLPIDDMKAFDEALFILMCGSGVGFSVERQYVNQLPEVPYQLFESGPIIVVKDSKEGWAKALRMLIALLYSGEIAKWDTSKVRPAGTPLKTFGGRASGPEPLEDLFRFIIRIFQQAKGRKLTSIECHDIMCKIGEVVVVGGVRRAALISLSNLSDDRMRHAKAGHWWELFPQRAMSNNSAVYTEKPDVGAFMTEWLAIYESKSGERGIFSRAAAKKVVARNGRRDPNYDFGTNPCSEIILRPNGFCNLSEVVVRANDSIDSLCQKVKLAAVIGTLQSTLTHFPYLRKNWQKNAEEERLLGVSLTGIYDCSLLNDHHSGTLVTDLEQLKHVVVETNREWAHKLGINQATATTCVKPSGTVSSLVDCASGIHPRHSKFYLRRVRGDNKDPITEFMRKAGVPSEPEVMNPNHMTVFTFPMKAPEGALTRDDVSAIDHLELWSLYAKYFCEHKPSVTISVKDHEWPRVGGWVYDHFDDISGVSFLPYDGGTYRQAPFEAVDQEQYEKTLEKMPEMIDWDKLIEKQDNVEGVQQLACLAGNCDV